MKPLLAMLVASVVLSGCGEAGPVAKGAKNTVAIPATSKPTPRANASGAPPANRAEAQALPPAASSGTASNLPAALLGRWGLTPVDCTSTKGDAKGLMIVNPTELRFYESRAVPTGDVQTDARTASGTFHFTGEGQSWSKFEALQLQKDLLVRTESNPSASFTYAKCS